MGAEELQHLLVGHRGQLGLLHHPELCELVSSPGLLVRLGYLREQSLFPNHHSAAADADSGPQQLTSASSRSSSHPSPPVPVLEGDPVVVVCLQRGTEGCA